MNKDKNYLIFFFSFVSFLSVLFIYNNYLELAEISFVEWLNNYNYGFIRRGLMGTLSFNISKFLKIDLFTLTLIFQILFYLLFYFFSLKIILHSKNKNFIFFLFLLSPLGFIYPLAETSALGRQEVIFLSFSALFFYSLLKNKKTISQFILFILIPVTLFTHEGMVVFFPYLILANLLFLQENKFKINLVFIIYIVFLIIFFLSNIEKNPIYIDSICKELSDRIYFDECKKLNGIAKILEYDSAAFDQFIRMFKTIPVSKNIFFLLIGYIPLMLMINNKLKVKILFINLSPNLIFLFCFILTFPIFTAADWGRWIYVNYICTIFLLLFLIDKKIVELNNSAVIRYFDYLSNKYKILIIMIFCFSWNLKLLHTDDIGSLSLYRILRKSIGLISKLFF